jgi:hypothetical protein
MNIWFRVLADDDFSVIVLVPLKAFNDGPRAIRQAVVDGLGISVQPKIIARGVGQPLTAEKLQALVGEHWWVFCDGLLGGARIRDLSATQGIRAAAAQATHARAATYFR